MARWLSWLERCPVTAEVKGSNPFRVVLKDRLMSILFYFIYILFFIYELLVTKEVILFRETLLLFVIKVYLFNYFRNLTMFKKF